MAKRIGAVNQIVSECLENVDDQEAVEEVAKHFAAISQEYEPLQVKNLPYYLPAERPPQVTEESVYQRLKKLKKTKSTLPLDLPCKLTHEFAAELSFPLTDIFNSSLVQQKYPTSGSTNGSFPHPKFQIQSKSAIFGRYLALATIAKFVKVF